MQRQAPAVLALSPEPPPGRLTIQHNLHLNKQA